MHAHCALHFCSRQFLTGLQGNPVLCSAHQWHCQFSSCAWSCTIACTSKYVRCGVVQLHVITHRGDHYFKFHLCLVIRYPCMVFHNQFILHVSSAADQRDTFNGGKTTCQLCRESETHMGCGRLARFVCYEWKVGATRRSLLLVITVNKWL